MLAIVKANGTGHGAPAQPAQQAKCKADGPRAGSLLVEEGCPVLEQSEQIN
jgi:hypothetical protein